jgi:alkanesulfonate monooxygenase SsuD/methylene tetrahydromethanopterin reductase-like flavin-dependent oxidoreductase (luciferase family)
MSMAIIRFDMRAPGMEPREARRQYEAALEMARWADERSFDMLVLSEHHGSDDGYLPSPLVMAGAVAGCTTRMSINVAALLVPLHDPLRLAEDLAVLDLLSGGRISIVAGLGYRPIEYAMFDREWKRRGKRMDECLEVMFKAWTGEPFEHNGETVRVTPRPLQEPHPLVMIGGSGEAAARRAARFGLGFFPPLGDDRLVEVYREECRRLGNEPGLVLAPDPKQPGTVFVSDDPDKAWQELGPYLLHDAMVYKSWQSADIRSSVSSAATTIEELRAEGIYQILTPDECVSIAAEMGPFGAITHHPLCGGTPPELAWPSLELFVDRVLPRMRGES